jgi:hypothetical protein
MLRRLIEYCTENQFSDFIHRFLYEDVLMAANSSAETIWKTKATAASVHFNTDETAVLECSPYLLKFMVSISLEKRLPIIVSSKTFLPALFSLCITHAVKFWDSKEMKIVNSLLNSAMQIIFFAKEYLSDFCANGVVGRLVNTPLLTYVMKDIDFMSEDRFSEDQK